MKRSVTREYEDVMTMLREVMMHQYEQSPNTTAFFRSQGVGSTCVDPLLRLTEICTPDSLDHSCSIFEAYRNMVFHVMRQGDVASQPASCFCLHESSRRDLLPSACTSEGPATHAPCPVPCTC